MGSSTLAPQALQRVEETVMGEACLHIRFCRGVGACGREHRFGVWPVCVCVAVLVSVPMCVRREHHRDGSMRCVVSGRVVSGVRCCVSCVQAPFTGGSVERAFPNQLECRSFTCVIFLVLCAPQRCGSHMYTLTHIPQTSIQLWQSPAP